MKSIINLLIVFALMLPACGAPATPAAPTNAPTVAPSTAPSVAPTVAPTVASTAAPSATAIPPTATSAPTLVPNPTAIPPSPTPAQKEVLVIIHNFDFVPKFITVTAGTKVTWMVEQGTHTTTSDDFRTQGPNAWHSGNLTVGQKFSFTFNNPGQFRYFCGFHSEPGQPLTAGNMNGMATVTSP